jgi:hypothetical protein
LPIIQPFSLKFFFCQNSLAKLVETVDHPEYLRRACYERCTASRVLGLIIAVFE